MTLAEALRDDHALLRSKVALLESALASIPQARLAFREKCFSLTRLLTRHMKREAPLVRLYYERIPTARYLPRPKDHSAEHALLRAITELLLEGVKTSVPLLILRVSQAIEQLQEQMEDQDRTLFPFCETLGEETPTSPAEPHARRPEIAVSMSVNAILQRYPQAERVFEPLRVNRLGEGYESVEELAWRRGVDAQQLLEQLRQAASEFPSY